MRTSTIRPAVLLILSALALPSVSGCWDRKEINDLAFVTAAAIDRTEEGTVELSVQVFIPRAGGRGNQLGQSGGSEGGDSQTVVRSAKGKSIAEAMSRLQERFPRSIFWGHAEAYIFGEETAKSGISDLVDFFLRFSQPREHAKIFVSRGKARTILELSPPIERYQAEVLREMAETRIGVHVSLKDLAEMLVGDAGNAVLPILTILPPEGKDKKRTIAYISGTAIFRKDRMIGVLNQRLTRGLLWLRDEIQSSVVTISPRDADGYVSFYLLRSHTKLIPRIEGNNWSLTVKIKTEDDVIENTTGLDVLDPEVTDTLETELERAIVMRIEQTLKQVQQEMKTDVTGFAEAFHRRYPHEWHRVKDRWDEKFPEVEVRVEVDAKILRPGESGKIITRPEDGNRRK